MDRQTRRSIVRQAEYEEKKDMSRRVMCLVEPFIRWFRENANTTGTKNSNYTVDAALPSRPTQGINAVASARYGETTETKDPHQEPGLR